jgi:hypothetical protein
MNWLRALIRGFVLLAILAASVESQAFANEVDFKKGLPSVVWVVSPMKDGTASGSGALIDERRGLVLTAYHVVEDRPEIVAFFPARDATGKLVTNSAWFIKRFITRGLSTATSSRPTSSSTRTVRPRSPTSAWPGSPVKRSPSRARAGLWGRPVTCRPSRSWVPTRSEKSPRRPMFLR